MIDKAKVRSVLVGLTPPIVYPMLRTVLNSAAFTSLSKRLGVNFYSSTWNTIKKGKFKGISLFLDASKGSVWSKDVLSGAYDDYIFHYLKSSSLLGKTHFDIGAHVGITALCFAQLVGSKGRVVAFEPNTFNLERLYVNINRNTPLKKRIQVEPLALSNKNGKEEFTFSSNIEDGTSSGSFLSSAHTILDKDSYVNDFGFRKVQVKTITLDSYVQRTGLKPDSLKIDVEGAEIFVLEGAKQTLKKHHPMMFIELHSIYNAFRVAEMLVQMGYAMKLLHEERDGRCFIVAKHE